MADNRLKATKQRLAPRPPHGLIRLEKYFTLLHNLHEITDQVLGDVFNTRLFSPVDAALLIDPLFAGAEASRAVVELAVCWTEQSLVHTRLGGEREVTTSVGASRHRTEPVRTVLARLRDRRSASLHISLSILYAIHNLRC